MTKAIPIFLSLLVAFCYASILRDGYDHVNGIPYNRNAKADPVYPFCPVNTSQDACSCFQGEMDYLPSFICNRPVNTENLTAYFDRLFPTYLVRNITIAGGSFVSIPANVFADKQPIRISIVDARFEYVDPKAFANANLTLETLEIERNPLLQSFPFISLNEFPKLRFLNLSNNDLRDLSEIANMNVPRLESIDVSLNPLARALPNFPFFSSLRTIAARSSGITSIPKEKPFYYIEVLETLLLSGNPLTTIETLTFEFQALSIKTIDLSNCNISNMEPNAFSGISSNTEILLNENYLTTLSSDVFKPVLETMAEGSGYVDVTDNPITCCCEVNWLINSVTLQAPLRGAVCAGGAPIDGLPTEYLNPLCPPL